MRYLCYNLIFIDVSGFLDENFCIFKDAITNLIVWTVSWCVCAIITIILAFRHFYRVKQIIK